MSATSASVRASDLVDRHVWIDREFDRDWLRSQTSVALSLALAMLDTIPPVR